MKMTEIFCGLAFACMMLPFTSGMMMAQTTAPQTAPAFVPPKPATDESQFGAKISRTMTALATSTPQKRNPVKILFYGQSITAQQWSAALANRLKKQYPNADITWANKAIGGFTAERLIQTATHDLYPYYPDLVVFHVYSGLKGEYENIIANIRKKTAAEIMISTHHVSHVGNDKANASHEAESENIRRVAAKYDCELVEVREEWKQYLMDNQLTAKDFLKDSVHLNDPGCKLMEELHWRHFRYSPDFPNPHAQWVSQQPVAAGADGRIKIAFDGNRVDILADAGKAPFGSAKILIDGKAPSEFHGAYTITRASNALGVWWPAIHTISNEKPLIVEDWILRVTEISEDGKNFRYDVIGSKTGADGSGNNKEKFVSNSGRVVIDPKDFGTEFAATYSKKKMPAGYEIKWAVKPMFLDVYRAPEVKDKDRTVSTTLVQLIDNGPHSLEIIPNGDGIVPVKAIRSFRPPLK